MLGVVTYHGGRPCLSDTSFARLCPSLLQAPDHLERLHEGPHPAGVLFTRERASEGGCVRERASEGESSQVDTELCKVCWVHDGRSRASLNQAASQFAPAGVGVSYVRRVLQSSPVELVRPPHDVLVWICGEYHGVVQLLGSRG